MYHTPGKCFRVIWTLPGHRMARMSISSSKGPFFGQKYAFLAFSPKDAGAKFFRQLIPKGLAQTFPTVYKTLMMYFVSPSLPSPPL